MRVLITGGAGYIGSRLAQRLLGMKHEVIIIDSLVTGKRFNIPVGAQFIESDLGLLATVDQTLSEFPVDIAIDCAGISPVYNAPSFALWHNDYVAKFYFLQALCAHHLTKFIYTSSIDVYGPTTEKIKEENLLQPVTSFGRVHAVMESFLADLAQNESLQSIILRIGAVNGATSDGSFGSIPLSPNFISLALRQTTPEHFKSAPLSTAFPTPYSQQITNSKNSKSLLPTIEVAGGKSISLSILHVEDLISAYLLAIQQIRNSNLSQPEIYNIASSEAHSPEDILTEIESQTQIKIQTQKKNGKISTPSQISLQKAQSQLGWKPKYTLKDIIRSEWEAYRNFPKNYAETHKREA